MARKYIIKCDGCQETVEKEVNKLPHMWVRVNIIAREVNDHGNNETFDGEYELCNNCWERLHPKNWSF